MGLEPAQLNPTSIVLAFMGYEQYGITKYVHCGAFGDYSRLIRASAAWTTEKHEPLITTASSRPRKCIRVRLLSPPSDVIPRKGFSNGCVSLVARSSRRF